MEDTPNRAQDEPTVSVASLLGTATPATLSEAIARLHSAGAPLSVFFSGPVNIHAASRNGDGELVDTVVERLHEWVDEAVLTSAGVAAALAATGYQFQLTEFVSTHSNPLFSAWEGACRIVPDNPTPCLLTDIRTLPSYASVMTTLTPSAPSVSGHPTSVSSTRQGFDEKLSVLATRWLEMKYSPGRHDGWKPKTFNEYRAAVTQCIEIVGDKHTSELTPADAAHYLATIRALPRDFYKNRERKYRNQAPAVAAKANLAAEELIAPKTLFDKTGMVSQFFEYLTAQGYLARNLFAALYKLPSSYKPQEARDPFSDAQLVTLFQGDGAQRLAQTLANRKHQALEFWGPLLGLFTGARAGEVSQLSAADVLVSDDGTPYLRINDGHVVLADRSRRHQKVKTQSSRREVPLHPVLLQLGFLDFAAVRRKAGTNAPLFPEAWTRRDADKVYQRLSTAFSKQLKDAGIKTSKLAFHSFHHTVVQRFRSDSRYLYQAHQFCGHDSDLPSINTMQGARYGKQFTPKELSPLLDLLTFPIDWADLLQQTQRSKTW